MRQSSRGSALDTVADVEKEMQLVKKQLSDMVQENDQMRKKISDNKLRTQELEEIVSQILIERVVMLCIDYCRNARSTEAEAA